MDRYETHQPRDVEMLRKLKSGTSVQRVALLVMAVVVLGGIVLTVGQPLSGQQPPPAAPTLAASQQPTFATPEIVLRAYPCPAGQAEAIAAQLTRELQAMPNVRVVADNRVGQVLVNAPQTVQSQIAARMALVAPKVPANPLPPAQTTMTIQAVAPVTPPASKAMTVPLQKASTQEIESTLISTLKSRLTPIASAGGAIRNYRVTLPGGSWLDLGIHHQSARVTIQGPATAVDSFARLLQTLDTTPATAKDKMRLVSMQGANPAALQRAVSAIQAGTAAGLTENPMVTMLFQQPAETEAPTPATPAPGPAIPATPPGTAPPANGTPPITTPAGQGLIGPVQIEPIEGLDMFLIRGRASDVQQVLAAIEQIEIISQETIPKVDVYRLRHVDSVALAELITPLYEEIYLPRQGTVSITALVRPNALLLIGREENVQSIKGLIGRLDRPAAPLSVFHVFRLRHASAVTVQTTLAEYFAERGGLVGPGVLVQADYRSNSVIVRAGTADVAEAAKLIQQIDTPDGLLKENVLRVYYLKNTLAEDLQEILQEALVGEGGAGGQPGAGQQGAETMSMKLSFSTIDGAGSQQLTSGVLTDVRITADVRANSIVVSAPEDSIELIAALIRELDKLPAAQSLVKVFTIENGDATSLGEMLQALFGEQTTNAEPAVRTGATGSESSLVRLQFAVDTRTNSIVASGGMGDLKVVEAILLRLDDSEIRQRTTNVYRLKNAPANDVATAINNFLTSERQVQQIEPGLMSPFEQLEREVVVVPEPISNSLLLSATKRFYEEIEKLIKDLDKQPPMVMIQVVIAEVKLDDTDEFGVELGLQDSILFDRSLLGDIVTTTQSTSTPGTGVVVTNDIIQSATNTPGLTFNNQSLGNSGAQSVLDAANLVGGQALSHFSVGRVNSDLNFGGLVLSAASESVNVLIRALQENRETRVLARPQVMTLDNQPAFVQVGERVPIIRSVNVTDVGQSNTVELTNVGLIMAVTPRINDDGLVVMEIDVENSRVGPESEGIPVSISATGEVVRSPRIELTYAQTTVSAVEGQTIILGGLLSTKKEMIKRRVPYLADIPLLGDLFRYDFHKEQRAEMLIFMTPHIIRNEADAEKIRQVEASRMSWCLSDVIELHGDPGMRGRDAEWLDSETRVIYPDLDPTGQEIPISEEDIEIPEGPTMPPMPGDTPGKMVPTPAPVTPLPNDGAMRIGPSDQARYARPANGAGIHRVGYAPPPATMNRQYPQRNPVIPSTYPPPQSYPWPPAVRPADYQQQQPYAVDAARYHQPGYPSRSMPTYQQPTYQQPAYQQPSYERPPASGATYYEAAPPVQNYKTSRNY